VNSFSLAQTSVPGAKILQASYHTPKKDHCRIFLMYYIIEASAIAPNYIAK